MTMATTMMMILSSSSFVASQPAPTSPPPSSSSSTSTSSTIITCPPSFSGHVPSYDCSSYALCSSDGLIVNDEILQCEDGTLFDVSTLVWDASVGGLVGTCEDEGGVTCQGGEGEGEGGGSSSSPPSAAPPGGVTTTTTTTNAPSTSLYGSVVESVTSDLDEANAQAQQEMEAGAEGGGEEEELWVPSCEGIDTGNVVGPACSSYATCNAGVVVGSPVACTAGTLYNKALGICDHEANVICYTSSGEGEGEGGVVADL